MTDEQIPAPMPSSDPPPLAPYVQQASAPTPAAPPVTPPPVAWGAPPVAAAAGQRTPLAMVAGILLVLLSIGGGLIGLMIAIFGSAVVKQLNLDQYGDFGGLNDPAAVVGGFLAFIGVIVVVYSIVYLVAGIGVLRSRGWGRTIGIIVGILSGIFWLLSLSGNGGGGLFVIVLLAMHAYIAVVLLFFWRSRAA